MILLLALNKSNHFVDFEQEKFLLLYLFIYLFFNFFCTNIRMEPTSQNNSIKGINDVRTLLNELRNNLSCEETKRIRERLYKKEVIYNFLKEKEQEGSLTNKEKKVLKNIDRYPKNISIHLKNLKKHFKKLQKYQYGIDYLFNEHSKEDYASNNDTNAFNEVRKLFNERRSNLLLKETKRIRKELYKKRGWL